MIIKLNMKLDKCFFPIDNRQTILSFIKKSLMNYNTDLFNENYAKDSKGLKKFTFAVKFRYPVFEKEMIKLADNNIEVNFSTGDFAVGIDLYNAFLLQRNKEFPLPSSNTLVLKRVQIMNHETISQSSVCIKMLSPLIVRNHIKGTADKYLIYNDEEFADRLYEIIKYELKELCSIDLEKSAITLEPVNAKKTVSYAMGIRFACSIGTFRLTASPAVINALYQYGIGSRRSAGFGMFDII